MASKTKTIQGIEVPALGLGTYELNGEDCRRAVSSAIEIGYRHIDTARAYENEIAVGLGLSDSGIDRDDIFLVSKIWFEDLNFTSVLSEVNQSLKQLQTDYLDLLLIHWPNREIPLQDTFAAMQRLQEAGIVRRFGVSNFTPEWLHASLQLADIFCDQVEFHPLLRRYDLHRLALEHDLLFTAYSPLARGEVHCDALEEIANKHGKTAEQVSLRWLLDFPNVAAVPRSSNPDHIRQNFEVWDFELDDDDRKSIEELPNGRHTIDPEFAPAWEV